MIFARVMLASLAFSLPEIVNAANTSPTSFSGGSITALDDLLDFVKVLSEGAFGRFVAFAMALVGVGISVVSQSLKGKATAIGAAACLALGPQIIEGVFAAVI